MELTNVDVVKSLKIPHFVNLTDRTNRLYCPNCSVILKYKENCTRDVQNIQFQMCNVEFIFVYCTQISTYTDTQGV